MRNIAQPQIFWLTAWGEAYGSQEYNLEMNVKNLAESQIMIHTTFNCGEGVNVKIESEECEGSHCAEEKMKLFNRNWSPQKISYILYISPMSFWDVLILNNVQQMSQKFK